MANDSEKKIYILNRRIIKTLRIGLVVFAALYAVLQFGIFRHEFTMYTALTFGTHSFAIVYIYLFLLRLSKPKLDTNGRVISGGLSLRSGLADYLFDGLYVVAISLLGSTYSYKALYVLLLMPLYMLSLLWTKLLKPLIFSRRPDTDTAGSSTGVSTAGRKSKFRPRRF